MKFMSFMVDENEKYGIVDEARLGVWDIVQFAKDQQIDYPASLQEMIEGGEDSAKLVKELYRKASETEQYFLSFDELTWLAPLTRPRKNIMCVGKNYRDHAIEMGSEADIPEHVMVFTKAPTTVTGHLQSIERHEKLTSELDYEGELALVIGKKGRNIARDKALDFVFGYTIINDITARDLQQRHKQFFIGKSLDTSCPIGPWIVHKEELPEPGKLSITTKVNGEIRQQSNTEHFIFPIEEIISVLSRGMTLEPGDIIATGTPAGVGKGFKPPRFLQKGDEIEIEIEKIGKLNNIVK
ncbi:fumarylacetoacetate hydrolase family protein [Bacillus sp. FJAT-50079]|uniref:fumarylacetoacetate hydrolase family protein n=1 Tax=Bacillus sp. FJAT-50079 TaxID=2833577 RepID=UPI001BCA4C18|nr:fumarylacetoacetate hydrolase family protein [Bacillus sp. FJAT-50079]MBS4210660.1 fumarylacetoacetate hydrolase family protein [Bacillus sp. FJAT-50079]